MLNEAESSRRRELQRRAYAAGGGVSEAELAELRDLDARAAPIVEPEEQAPSVASEPADPSATPERVVRGGDEGHPPSRVGDAVPEEDEAREEASDDAEEHVAPDGRRRPRVPILVLSTLVALVLGFAGAWMLLNRADTPTMTADQASAMAEIEKTARFDPGSIVYLGEKYDASVWRATSDDGAKVCVAIHVADRNEYQCTTPPEDADDSPFSEPVGVSLSQVDGEKQWSYWATLVSDITEREVLVIQRYDMSAGFDWRSQFTEGELEQIEKLTAQGVAPEYLQVVGYDADVPVFISQAGRTCVYVVDPTSDAAVESCEPDDGVYILSVGSTTYEVRETPSRGPMLTVVRNGG